MTGVVQAKCTPTGHRPVNIMQINLHHSKLAMSMLDMAISNLSEVVVLAQEPYAPRGQVSELAHMVQVHQGPGPRPRRAIFSKNVNLWYCSSLSDGDSVTCVGYIGKKKTYINSSYCDGNVLDVSEALEQTVVKASIGGHGLLIGMDLNAHSLVW